VDDAVPPMFFAGRERSHVRLNRKAATGLGAAALGFVALCSRVFGAALPMLAESPRQGGTDKKSDQDEGPGRGGGKKSEDKKKKGGSEGRGKKAKKGK